MTESGKGTTDAPVAKAKLWGSIILWVSWSKVKIEVD